MRAWISYWLVVSFGLLFLSYALFVGQSSQRQTQSVHQWEKISHLSALQVEFKDAVHSALPSCSAPGREPCVREAALRLVQLEPFLEARWRKRGIQADVWCGTISPNEQSVGVSGLRKPGTPLKPLGASDWNRVTLDYRKQPAPFLTGFLQSDGRGVWFSRAGAVWLPELYPRSFTPDYYGCGVSVLDGNNTAIFLLQEGFA